MATTEIEKLERRYAENPQGLTFAPLAEVHRKNGELTRALELLRAGLELHPNYIPASIVLGRCHWDLGDLPAAETAFSHVLRLDDENVIALKSLADISERLGRFSEAQRWLNRLISVDRSNEEARQQLARIESAKQQPASTPSPSPSPSPASIAAVPVTPAAPVPEIKAAPVTAGPAERKPVAAVAPEPEAASPPPLIQAARAKEEPAAPATAAAPDSKPAFLDLTAAIAEPKPAELEFLDTSVPSPSVPPDAVRRQDVDSPAEEPAPLPGLISQEFVPPKEGAFRSHPELSHDYGSPRAVDEDDLQVETAAEVELQSSGASEFRVPNAAEEFMDASAPVVKRPQDIEKAPPPAYEPPEAVQQPPSEEPAPSRRSYSVQQTHGQSVGAFFQRLLSSRPVPGSAAAGSPSSSAAGTQIPAPQGGSERGQAAASAAAAGSPTPEPTVSFDDFFGPSTSDATPAGKKEADTSKDDLDQFQSWLQNLKR